MEKIEWVTVEQLAEEVRVHHRTVRNWLDSMPEGAVLRTPGGHIRLDRSRVMEWLSNGKPHVDGERPPT